jgi:hypothetical protein
MNTVTPFPTLTPFPTPAATLGFDLAPVAIGMDAGKMGPQVVQYWDMWIAPNYAEISGLFLLVLVVLFVAEFFLLFRSING